MDSYAYLGMIMLILLIDLLIAQLFFTDLFSKRFSNIIVFLIGAVIFSADAWFVFKSANPLWIYIFSFPLAHALFLFICFKSDSVRQRIFPLLLIMGMTLFRIFVTIGGLPVFDGIGLDPVYFIPFAEIILKALYCAAAAILLHIKKKKNRSRTVSAAYLLYPVFCVLLMILLFGLSLSRDLYFEGQPILPGICILLFAGAVFLVFAQLASVDREKDYLFMQKETQKMQTDLRYYEILEKKNDTLRIYAHDAKNHLLALKALTSEPEALAYIDSMQNSLSEYGKVKITGNHLLDVMLDRYQTQSELNGISFSVIQCTDVSKAMNDYDLVTILGNLLDNAIEAASQTEQKTVSVSIKRDIRFVIIEILNSCDVSPDKDKNGRWKTSKDEKKLHGIGLKSVQHALTKLGGDMENLFDCKKKQMLTTVIVPERIESK